MRKRTRGASLVEFAFVIPIFFMATLNFIMAGLMLLDIHDIKHLARDGARQAAVRLADDMEPTQDEEKISATAKEEIQEYIFGINTLVVYDFQKSNIGLEVKANNYNSQEYDLEVSLEATRRDDVFSSMITLMCPEKISASSRVRIEK